jgi:hypothetical protein
MRTVSSFSSGATETEGGRIEADKGGEASGAFGGGKKFVDEVFSMAEPGSGGHERGIGGLPLSRTGNSIRTVSRGLTGASGDLVAGGSGNSIRTVSFFGWSGSTISVGAIDQKSLGLSLANLAVVEIALHATVATSFRAPHNTQVTRPAATTWIKSRYARRS